MTSQDPRFETIRDMLSERYHGVMDPITDEAVQAVLDEMDEEGACPRCRAVSWGRVPDGRLECTRCQYVEG